MAQLKDLLVNGVARFISDVFTNKIQITSLSAPTTSGGTTYGAGTSGQALMSNGTSIYWGTIPAPDLSSKVSKTGDTMTGKLTIQSGGIGFYNDDADYHKTITLTTSIKNVQGEYTGYVWFDGNVACSLAPTIDADLTNKGYVDARTLPTGGTAGQFLVKSSATNYDAAWVTVPSANGVSF